jgi:hypothetical protein
VRTAWRIFTLVLAGVLVAPAISSIVAANYVYNVSGRWFARATYVAQCTKGAASSPVGCARLAAEPRPPTTDGVEVTDKEVLLAEGTTTHNVGTALVTIAGVLLAAATLAVALAETARHRARETTLANVAPAGVRTS